MKKIILFSIGIFSFLLLVLAYERSEDFILENEENESIEQKQIVVAACPTFYYMLDKIKEDRIANILRVENTGEGLKLMSERKIDVLVSGRALKIKEPDLPFMVVGPGYDFIYANEIVLNESEMMFVPFYTDLDLEEIVEDFEYISTENIEKVDNVFNYLDQGVVVTLLEDRMKGEPVHIIKNNETRVRLSRRPRMYYLPHIDKDTLKEVKNIIKEY